MAREDKRGKRNYAQYKINSSRHAAALKAIVAREHARDPGYDCSPEPMDDRITDLLTDLRHLADKYAVDYSACDRRAYDNYLAERA